MHLKEEDKLKWTEQEDVAHAILPCCVVLAYLNFVSSQYQSVSRCQSISFSQKRTQGKQPLNYNYTDTDFNMKLNRFHDASRLKSELCIFLQRNLKLDLNNNRLVITKI